MTFDQIKVFIKEALLRYLPNKPILDKFSISNHDNLLLFDDDKLLPYIDYTSIPTTPGEFYLYKNITNESNNRSNTFTLRKIDNSMMLPQIPNDNNDYILACNNIGGTNDHNIIWKKVIKEDITSNTNIITVTSHNDELDNCNIKIIDSNGKKYNANKIDPSTHKSSTKINFYGKITVSYEYQGNTIYKYIDVLKNIGENEIEYNVDIYGYMAEIIIKDNNITKVEVINLSDNTIKYDLPVTYDVPILRKFTWSNNFYKKDINKYTFKIYYKLNNDKILFKEKNLEIKSDIDYYEILLYSKKIYGFKELKYNKNVNYKIRYIKNTENENYIPAGMDYDKDIFDYGSWKDAFFMPKPCMLKYDGTVDYYLDPNNYELKQDGTPSDIYNLNYKGNAMMEFPLIYFKRYNDDNYNYCYISNEKIDDDYHAYTHYNKDGELQKYIYVAIYQLAYDGNTLPRSICASQTWTLLNNITELGNVIKNIRTANKSDRYGIVDYGIRCMISDLCILMSKQYNFRIPFGGIAYPTMINDGDGGWDELKYLACNKSGLFYGNKNTKCKIFGMEWVDCGYNIVTPGISIDNDNKLRTKMGYTMKKDKSDLSDYYYDNATYNRISTYYDTNIRVNSSNKYIEIQEYNKTEYGDILKTYKGYNTDNDFTFKLENNIGSMVVGTSGPAVGMSHGYIDDMRHYTMQTYYFYNTISNSRDLQTPIVYK